MNLSLSLLEGLPAPAPVPSAAQALEQAGGFGLLLRQLPPAAPALPAPPPPSALLPAPARQAPHAGLDGPGAGLLALLDPLQAALDELEQAIEELPAHAAEGETAPMAAPLAAAPLPTAPAAMAAPAAAGDGGPNTVPAILAPVSMPTGGPAAETPLAPHAVSPAGIEPRQAPAPQGPQPEPALPAASAAGVPDAELPPGSSASAATAGSAPSSTAAHAPAGTPRELPTPLASAQWGQDLGRRMAGIMRQGETKVSLRLNPAELGPLLVELKLNDQQAQLHFASSHAQVRQVVEQAIPQLREALAEQGISLGEALVGEQHAGAEREAFQHGGFARETPVQGTGTFADAAVSDDTAALPLAGPGQVNLYV